MEVGKGVMDPNNLASFSSFRLIAYVTNNIWLERATCVNIPHNILDFSHLEMSTFYEMIVNACFFFTFKNK